VSLENPVNRLELKASSNKQTDPKIEAKIAALQAEFAAMIATMTDEELRAIAYGGGENMRDFNEFSKLSDHELWEIIARES
jgi:pyruvate dehydrogenase complex dehydrogenase (E1) component